MARSPTPPILSQIRSPTSNNLLLDCLKALKNDVVGHDQRKEMWIARGIVASLVKILSSGAKRKSMALNGDAGQLSGPPPLTEEEATRLEVVIILGSLAQGGPSFVTPLLHSAVTPALLGAISPADNPPQVVLATLRTLNVFADALGQMRAEPLTETGSFSNLVFSRLHAPSLADILSQNPTAPVHQQQISLVATLIAKLCREERHQSLLAKTGVLDALASNMASFVVAMGFVIPTADSITDGQALAEAMPEAAPSTAELSPIFEAIHAIILDSKVRAAQFLRSPALAAVFPAPTLEKLPPDFRRSVTLPSGTFSPSQSSATANPLDMFLPRIQAPQPKHTSSQSSAFPPLGSGSSSARIAPIGQHSSARSWLSDSLTLDSTARAAAAEAEQSDHSLIAWLIHIARARHDITSLTAASILAVLHRAGLTSKKREMELGMLIVPLLVRMLTDGLPGSSPTSKRTSHDEGVRLERTIRERAPAILAMLMTDSVELQKAAVDAHAIGKLCQMLRTAYDPITEPPRVAPWTPDPSSVEMSDASDAPETLRLGDAGISVAALHQMRVRESVLMALAAVAPFKDEYKTMIIDNGVTPFIVLSLKPMGDSEASTPRQGNGTPTPTDGTAMAGKNASGNPIPVLIAACSAVRALSRSVSILRTHLIDAGVAGPLLSLLRHSDIEVQIASTAAVCNLVLEFSPMRESISRAGVLKILCEHAHSSHARLRINALWALKHLMFSAENDVKIACLEELGQAWLIQILCDDEEWISSRSTAGGRDAATAASGDVHDGNGAPLEETAGEEETNYEGKMTDSIGALSRHPPDRDLSSEGAWAEGSRQAGGGSPALTSVRDKARRDDQAVQEQGLDLIRNLICGSIDMIDFLLIKFGQERIFEILSSKLRPKMAPVATGSQAGRSTGHGHSSSLPDSGNGHGYGTGHIETRVIQPHTEIVTAACYILVHIAAGHPRHRQLLTSQTELLKLLLPFFSHPSKNIRSALVWIVINVTWLDDEQDASACKMRALELKKLGFLGKLEGFEHDPELDVRERTKTALLQLKRAISS
ncbi:MAG: hypothetical protein M1817_005205 [Caeruleum heppii]|nr:MAG: hypothetical protein M1817_005205 [Caeruleum heppii]